MPRASTDLPIRKKPSTEHPLLFGSSKRACILMTLAVNRPMYTREIARAIGSEERKTDKMIRALKHVGVLVCGKTKCGARFVTLNRDFPAYRDLFRLLNVFELHWPQPRVAKPVRIAEREALRRLTLPVDDGPFLAKRFDNLFGYAVRTRVLLAIAAIEDTDVTDLTRLLTIGRRSAWNSVNHLQREGIVISTIIGRRRAIQLDSRYFAARELRRFLKRIVSETEEYAVLARFSNRTPGGPLQGVLR